MAQFADIESVTVPSIGQLPIKEDGVTFKTGGTKREHVAGLRVADGGFTSSYEPAILEVTLNAHNEVNTDELNKIENENISIIRKDGSQFVMPQAFCSELADISKGEIKVSFTSNHSEKI